MFFRLRSVFLDPACECEVLTVGEFGVLREDAESVAEYSGIFELGRQFVGENVAFFLDYLEFGGHPEVFVSVFLTVYNEFYTEVAADAIGVDDDFDAERFASDRGLEFA